MKARNVLMIPAALALAVVTACGGGGAGTGGGAGGEESGELPPIAVNEQPRDALQDGGEFRYPVEEFGGQWNPMHVEGNLAETQQMMSAVMPEIITFDEKGEFEPNPDYLTGVEATDDAPTVVTYDLNPDAKWNSGRKMGVQDFKAMWQACSGKNKKFECTSTQGFDQIKSVEQGDNENQVVVTYKGAYADWSGNFSTLVPQEGIKDPKTFNSGWTDLTEVGDWTAGPWKVDDLDATQKVLKLAPNDAYWGDEPVLDSITFKVVPLEAQANAFVNGELDAFGVGVDADAYAKARTATDGELRTATSPDWRHFTFNTEAGELTDIKVRQAIQKAINREQITKSDLAGMNTPPIILDNHIFVKGQTGYQSNVEEAGQQFNRDEAAALLEESGWEKGEDGMFAKDGETLTVKFSQLDGVAVSENEALQFQNQMKEFGIKVEIVNTPIAKFQDGSLLTGGEFEIVAFSWLGTPFPYPGIKQIWGTDQSSNYSNYSDKRIDKLANQIASEVDEDKRAELANQADVYMWEDATTMPLYQRPDIEATKSNLANWGAFGMADTDWQNIGYMKE